MEKKKLLPAIAGAMILTGGLAASTAQAGQCLPHSDACGKQGQGQARSENKPEVQYFRGAEAVAQLFSNPEGQSYGHWAADWVKWAVSIPAANNPMNDSTGEFCGERQTGKVWFLAGAWGQGSVERSCTIPAGKSLFFPLVNAFYAAALNENVSDDDARAQVAFCNDAQFALVEIDGRKVAKPARYFTGPSGNQSPLFSGQLPPDNIWNVSTTDAPELGLSPMAEQGYYLFVRPLSPGQHQIKWSVSGCTSQQDITYNLIVK